MQLLNDICNETGLTIDDARIVLMDVREDWETTDSVTDGEASLIRQTTTAALHQASETYDSTEIQPVADMPIEKQEQMIDNASQVLVHQMILSVQRRIEMLNAVDQLVNQVVLNNREVSQQQLAAAIAQQDNATKAELMRTIDTLSCLVNTPVEVAQAPDDSDFQNAIATVQKKMQR